MTDNKINLEDITLQYYPFVSTELVNNLWPLTLPDGDFRTVLTYSKLRDTLETIVAYGPRDGIYGWSGIYDKDSTYIGVYVLSTYRHNGLGRLLLNEALRICKERNRTCIWQDRKDHNKWVRVSPNGEEERTPWF